MVIEIRESSRVTLGSGIIVREIVNEDQIAEICRKALLQKGVIADIKKEGKDDTTN